MKEFGSDFHYIKLQGSKSLFDFIPNASFYADGRHAIRALINHCGFKRIWIPEYFCYEVINDIKETGIELCQYNDNPLCDDEKEISKIYDKFLPSALELATYLV